MGQRLSLADIKLLRFTGTDLLALSACETALGGGRNALGAEVEGFGAMAQQRGALAVLASLWQVSDDSTATLMQQFYRLRTGAGGQAALTKADACARRSWR